MKKAILSLFFLLSAFVGFGQITTSQISGHLFAPSGAYDSIATTTVGSGGASSITFSSIPATYTHLQIRFITRNNRSGQSVDALNIKANSDGGANYANHRLQGDGSSASGSGGSSLNAAIFAQTPASTATASVFGAGVIDILDYANTSKYKTFRTLSGFDANGSGYVGLYSGLWQSTSAINSLTISSNDGSGVLEYTSFALYGIRGN